MELGTIVTSYCQQALGNPRLQGIVCMSRGKPAGLSDRVIRFHEEQEDGIGVNSDQRTGEGGVKVTRDYWVKCSPPV